MPDTFDPYREALIMETNTIWPEHLATLEASRKARIEAAVHAEPKQCGHIDYVRVHTGFCRQITVTDEDVARIK